MGSFRNADGKSVLLRMVKAIQDHKAYLGEVDGLIGDGDHGMNMNKGFSMFETRWKDKDFSFSEGLDELGMILLNEIGGSMGPIYGTIFMDMGESIEDDEIIDTKELAKMFQAGLDGLCEIVEARVGDKTLVDTLSPARDSLQESSDEGLTLKEALPKMIEKAKQGQESTKDLMAKFGRSSRLGERSRGVLDAGATSCYLILEAMGNGILELL